MSQEKITVAIRARPLNKQEKAQNARNVWGIKDNSITGTGNVNNQYTFDHVFDESSATGQIYSSVGSNIVAGVLKGISGTIFAYGQTASGKTYTMRGITRLAVDHLFSTIRGHKQEREFTVRVGYVEIYNEQLQDLIATGVYPQGAERKPTVRLSGSDSPHAPSNLLGAFASVEGKQVTTGPARHEDGSLKPVVQGKAGGTLKVVTAPSGRTFVQGLLVQPIRCEQDLHRLLKQCESVRSVAKTGMNDRSSRSHGVVQIMVQSRPKHEPLPSDAQPSSPSGKKRGRSAIASPDRIGRVKQRKVTERGEAAEVPVTKITDVQSYTAVLNLVDLAGSERVAHTGAAGRQLKEAGQINKSLTTLARVIKALSHQRSREHKQRHDDSSQFVPYRDSKLTRILQPALGGSSRASVVCCVTLSHMHAGTTKSTLDFANRAKHIENKVAAQSSIVDQKAYAQSLLEEIASLKAKLSGSSLGTLEAQVDRQRARIETLEREKKDMDAEMELIVSQRVQRILNNRDAKRRQAQERATQQPDEEEIDLNELLADEEGAEVGRNSGESDDNGTPQHEQASPSAMDVVSADESVVLVPSAQLAADEGAEKSAAKSGLDVAEQHKLELHNRSKTIETLEHQLKCSRNIIATWEKRWQEWAEEDESTQQEGHTELITTINALESKNLEHETTEAQLRAELSAVIYKNQILADSQERLVMENDELQEEVVAAHKEKALLRRKIPSRRTISKLIQRTKREAVRQMKAKANEKAVDSMIQNIISGNWRKAKTPPSKASDSLTPSDVKSGSYMTPVQQDKHVSAGDIMSARGSSGHDVRNVSSIASRSQGLPVVDVDTPTTPSAVTPPEVIAAESAVDATEPPVETDTKPKPHMAKPSKPGAFSLSFLVKKALSTEEDSMPPPPGTPLRFELRRATATKTTATTSGILRKINNGVNRTPRSKPRRPGGLSLKALISKTTANK